MSEFEHEVHPYIPSVAREIPAQQEHGPRRSSLLDAGGASSIKNFASSVQRSVDYLSTSLESGKDREPFENGLSSPLLTGEDTQNDLETVLVDEDVWRSQGRPSYGTIEDMESTANIRVIKSNDSESIIRVVSMKSTRLQTIFNSINVLIGLGILSIPLALHLSGWALGILCMTFAALATRQTAVLLGRILSRHPQLKTYQDIGIFCFGENIGFVILLTFTLDLIGAGLSMILLFADSFNALSPDVFSKLSLKVFITAALMFLNFLPLRLLSFLSLTGIMCTTATCMLIGVSGCLKAERPGSLLNPMQTNMYPKSFIDFFFALGLYLAPWGGHATFPEIYRDQLYPQTYDQSMKYSFSFSYAVDLATGVLGFLMFGASVDDEITKNILRTTGYPPWVSTAIVVLMGILPVSKLPLISRPILTILDRRFGATGLQRAANRGLLSAFFLLCSLLLTNFGKVMSLLGSLICFTVCITLPGLYYLRVFRDDLSQTEKAVWRMLVAVGVAGAFFGTVAVVLK